MRFWVSKRKWTLAALLGVLSFSAGGLAAYARVEKEARVARRVERSGPALRKRQAAWNGLKRTLTAEIRRFDGQAGVVVEDLQTGWSLAHQPKRLFPAASIIKVPMMTACFEAAQEGRLDLNSKVVVRPADKVPGSGVLKQIPGKSVVPVSQLVEWMITESDNTATNVLMSQLGMDYFNQHFQELGLRDTKLSRRMMDFSKRKRGVENFTTAEDMACVLRKLYHSDSIEPNVARICINLLKRQHLHDRIPAKLPPGTPVAHKTGLERSVCHDAGIVFTRNGDLLICVLTQRKQTKEGSKPAKRFIARLALYSYRYLEP